MEEQLTKCLNDGKASNQMFKDGIVTNQMFKG